MCGQRGTHLPSATWYVYTQLPSAPLYLYNCDEGTSEEVWRGAVGGGNRSVDEGGPGWPLGIRARRHPYTPGPLGGLPSAPYLRKRIRI